MQANTHTTTRKRVPAVAGTFYPGSEDELADSVTTYLDEARAMLPGTRSRPKALIVPHAGYVYSGLTAACAYAWLSGFANRIRRVVLLGPVHRVPVRGLALPETEVFVTPLGDIPIDGDAVAMLAGLPQVVNSARAHAAEHSLEVQLPFLQSVLGEFKLLPLAVGDASAGEVAEVLDRLWGGDETLIVVSSDLSHYHSYGDAKRIDQSTVDSILGLAGSIDHQQACGGTPINGLLLCARKHGLRPRLIDLRNSGDTAGDRDRVVGYASIGFFADAVKPDLGAQLLALARSSVEAAARGQPAPPVSRVGRMGEPGATFVTLTKSGHLRGCIGSLTATRALAADVVANARAAALADPRFAPLNATELPEISVEVSLLAVPEPFAVKDEANALASLQPGIDGLIFEWRGHQATFLPQVWEQLPGPREFLMQLKLKAGLSANFWAPDVHLSRYRVQKWREHEH